MKKKLWEFSKKGRLCYICMERKHFSTNCDARKTCNVDDCVEYHSSILHKQSACEPETLGYHFGYPTTYYRSLPVELSNGDKNIVV